MFVGAGTSLSVGTSAFLSAIVDASLSVSPDTSWFANTFWSIGASLSASTGTSRFAGVSLAASARAFLFTHGVFALLTPSHML